MDNAWIIAFYKETDPIKRLELLKENTGAGESAEDESFSDGLLEYPQYTRPAVFRDMAVPEVLLNGNHALIAKWRRERSIEATYKTRPELIDEKKLGKKEKTFLQSLKNQDKQA